MLSEKRAPRTRRSFAVEASLQSYNLYEGNMLFNPAHPGEILRDYLNGISIREAVERLGVTRAHLSRILNGRASVTAAMSLRLSAALGTTPDFWLKMQVQRDLWLAKKAGIPKVRRFPALARRAASVSRLSY